MWRDHLSFKGVPLWLPVELAWGWALADGGGEQFGGVCSKLGVMLGAGGFSFLVIHDGHHCAMVTVNLRGHDRDPTPSSALPLTPEHPKGYVLLPL